MAGTRTVRLSPEEEGSIEAAALEGESVGRALKRLALERAELVVGLRVKQERAAGRVDPSLRRSGGEDAGAAVRASLGPSGASSVSRPSPAAPRAVPLVTRVAVMVGSESLALRAIRLGKVKVDGAVIRSSAFPVAQGARVVVSSG